ncbi:hypothetical protein ACVBE9_11605 [Eionea flava]
MMRALAEFMMRGRLQAGAIAMLGALIPLLTPAAVALTTLRKGATEGLSILLIGAAPALAALWFASDGEGNSLISWMALLSLLAVYIPACVLRTTISLSSTLIATLAVATVIAVMTLWAAPDVVDTMSDNLRQQMSALEQTPTDDLSSSTAGSPVVSPLMTLATTVGMSGLLAYILTANGLIGVLIGRWLQSLAFNPGGFGEEFRGLRLGIGFSAVCFLGNVLLSYYDDQYWWWANLLAIPLLLVAASVAHQVVRQRELGGHWLVLFYILALAVMPVVMSIGFLDAWLNFRDRLQKQ